MKHKKIWFSAFAITSIFAFSFLSLVSCSTNNTYQKSNYSLQQLNPNPIVIPTSKPNVNNTTKQTKTSPPAWTHALQNWQKTYTQLIQKVGFQKIVTQSLNNFFSYINFAYSINFMPFYYGIWFQDNDTSWAFKMIYSFSNIHYTLKNHEIWTLSYVQTVSYDLYPTTISQKTYATQNGQQTIIQNIYNHPSQYINFKKGILDFFTTTEHVTVTKATLRPILVNVDQTIWTDNANNYYAYGAFTINTYRNLLFGPQVLNYNTPKKQWNKLEQTFYNQFIKKQILNYQTHSTDIGGDSYATFPNQMQKTYTLTILNQNVYNQYQSYWQNFHLKNSNLTNAQPKAHQSTTKKTQSETNPKKIEIPTKTLPMDRYRFFILPNITTFNQANTSQDLIVPCTYQNGFYYGIYQKNPKLLKIKKLYFYYHFLQPSVGGVKGVWKLIQEIIDNEKQNNSHTQKVIPQEITNSKNRTR